MFVTNTERLGKGIELGCGNSILIKLNQIGSVSETLEAIKMAHKAGYSKAKTLRLLTHLIEENYVKGLGNGRGKKYTIA